MASRLSLFPLIAAAVQLQLPLGVHVAGEAQSGGVFANATVEYYHSTDLSLPPIRISSCVEQGDDGLFAEALADFPTCVRNEAVLTASSADSNHTQSVVDQGVEALSLGTPYSDGSGAVDKVCKHHAQLCKAYHVLRTDAALHPEEEIDSSTVSYTVDVPCGGLHGGTDSCSHTFRMSDCPYIGVETEEMRQCKLHRPVLEEADLLSWAEFDAVDVWRYNPNYKVAMLKVCEHHVHVCESVAEYQTHLSPGCRETAVSCRSALRHLHEMMFRRDESLQQCNVFALKSVRGFFHDSMTSDVEGSILWEMESEMNLGLCKWTEYVNVLSDATLCDPGTVIAMAGQLGFEACGADLWNMDKDVKPSVSVGRGYGCSANYNPSLNDATTGQRHAVFDDVRVASDAAITEDFWYAVNGHSHPPPDGEIEYSGEATAASHVIGRVTCPIAGTTVSGADPHLRTGYFDGDGAVMGMDNLKARFAAGLQRFGQTQCDASPTDGTPIPTGAVRSDASPDETNFSAVGGLCGMPTQFLGTVRVGNRHRTARWINIAQDNPLSVQPASEHQLCDARFQMLLPWELRTIADVPLPTSDVLDPFLDIAWDGVGTIASAWDSCDDLNCDNRAGDNRLCGGDGVGAAQQPSVALGELMTDQKSLGHCYDDAGNLVTDDAGPGWPGLQWKGPLEEAKQRCAARPDCRFLLSWGCLGDNWKYCSEIGHGADGTGTCAHEATVPTRSPTRAPTAGPTPTPCSICSDEPTSWMSNNGRECSTWTWAHANKCNSDISWRETKVCQYSCYMNGNGYSGDVCCPVA